MSDLPSPEPDQDPHHTAFLEEPVMPAGLRSEDEDADGETLQLG